MDQTSGHFAMVALGKNNVSGLNFLCEIVKYGEKQKRSKFDRLVSIDSKGKNAT